MRIESEIRGDEIVRNTNRKFGAAGIYYPAYYVDGDGQRVGLLFTDAEIADAKGRAAANPEDLPPPRVPIWRRLLAGGRK